MTETPTTIAQAQAAIEADRQARAERVAAGLQTLLEKEKCALDLFIESVPLGNGLWGQKPNARIVAQ
jgi:hypothetical protein